MAEAGIFNAAEQQRRLERREFSQAKSRSTASSRKQQPNNASAWENLLNAQLHEAGNEAYVTRTGQVTSKGKELFAQVGAVVEQLPRAESRQAQPRTGPAMVTVFGEEGLNEPAAAVQVLQIVVAARPTSASLYASLAEYAYKAHNTRVGDLASEKAVSLAPAPSGRV